ncbi:MAG TPA: DUF4446 family protein [Marmoricola sp.]
MTTAVSALALVVALAALGLVLRDRIGSRRDVRDDGDLPADTRALRQEVAALRAEAATALKHLAVVRYDAFGTGHDGGVGGKLSWSLAILDDHGDGAVLTAIHGRNEARAYAKSVTAWTCEQPLSPEEEQALAHARRP